MKSRTQRRGKSADGSPATVDIHVGARIKARRLVMGISQESLGHAVGVTFQQQQKRESGVNRVSASALYETAKALDVSAAYFFEGLPPTDNVVPEFDPMRDTRAVQLVGRFNKLKPRQQDAVETLLGVFNLVE